MGQHQSVISSSETSLPSLYYYGPDRKTILKRSRKNGEKVVGILEEVEVCSSKRMRCSNLSSDEQSMNPEVSVAQYSPFTSADSSQFVPSSSFPDSPPLADVSFSPSPSPPRKIVAAPFTDLCRRRTFLQLPEKEDSVVPVKKSKEVNNFVNVESQDAVYDSTPLRAHPKNCQWKTPEPIATSTPIHATAPQPKICGTRVPSVPRFVAPAPAAEAIEEKPDLTHKAPVVQLPTAPPRTTSLQKSAAERGFHPRTLPLPNFPQYPMNPMQMMQMMHFMQHQMRMQMMNQQTMNQPQNAMNQPQQIMNQPQQIVNQQQQTIQMQQLMMKQPQLIPQAAQLGQQPPKTSVKTEVMEQTVSTRPLPPSSTRPLFTPLANPGPLRSPLPKSTISRRPIYPQMGLTPRKVKQRQATVGLGVTEKMYGSIDGPGRKPSPLPILTNAGDVGGYATMAGLMSPMRPNAAKAPMPQSPMYVPPSPIGLNFVPSMSPVTGRLASTEAPQARNSQLPSYAQMYPSGGAQQMPPHPPGQFQNLAQYGQFV